MAGESKDVVTAGETRPKKRPIRASTAVRLGAAALVGTAGAASFVKGAVDTLDTADRDAQAAMTAHQAEKGIKPGDTVATRETLEALAKAQKSLELDKDGHGVAPNKVKAIEALDHAEHAIAGVDKYREKAEVIGSVEQTLTANGQGGAPTDETYRDAKASVTEIKKGIEADYRPIIKQSWADAWKASAKTFIKGLGFMFLGAVGVSAGDKLAPSGRKKSDRGDLQTPDTPAK